MHEWALAESIIDAVLSVAERENAKRVLEIDIVVGKLQTIDLEIFKTALDSIREGTLAGDAEVVFMEENPCFKCNICGYEWCIEKLGDVINENQIETVHFIPELIHIFITCPKCGKNDFEIVRGRGLYLKAVRVEKA